MTDLQQAGEEYDSMLNRILSEGGYHRWDNFWWIRSGIAGFQDDAGNHFYLPERFTDPFNNITTVV
jgi:hypothetical protein